MYHGPYPMVKNIGEVAYELQLPVEAKIHHVFHIAQLKRHVGSKDKVSTILPPMDLEGQFMLVPVKLLERMMIKRNNAAVGQWLIYWAHLPAEEAIWEIVDEIMAKQLHP